MAECVTVIPGAKYVHTNIVARDWRALARFYQDVFGCTPVPPVRGYEGPEVEAGTGVPGTHFQGMHLRLPGFSTEGPTLEIFEYSEPAAGLKPAVNRPGIAHLAFSVPSVEKAREIVLAHGGVPVGEIVTLATTAGAEVTWCYVRDPEDNIVELQSWTPQSDVHE